MARITTVGAQPGSFWDRDLNFSWPDGDIYRYAFLTIQQWKSAEPSANHKMRLRGLESCPDGIFGESELKMYAHLWSTS